MRQENSHLGIINESYNMEQLQSKNILTVPIKVFSFLTLKSPTVIQFTGFKVYTLKEKTIDG